MNTETRSSEQVENTSLYKARDGDYVVFSELSFLLAHTGGSNVKSGFNNEMLFSISATDPESLASKDSTLAAEYWRHDALVFPHNAIHSEIPIGVSKIAVHMHNLSEADVAAQVKMALDRLRGLGLAQLGWAFLGTFEGRRMVYSDGYDHEA